MSLPWIIVGYFNAIRSRMERSSGRILKTERLFFYNFIADHGLLEFDKVKPNFTYTNRHDIPTTSRLDHFLVNSNSVEVFGQHVEKPLGFFKSDHRICLLQDVGGGRKPKPFRFQLFWLNNEETLVNMK